MLSKQKAAQQEVDLLRERDAARRAEARLKDMSTTAVHSEGAKEREKERERERRRDSSSSLPTAPVPLELIPDPRSLTLVGSRSNDAYPYYSSDADDDRSVDNITGTEGNGMGRGRSRGTADAAVEPRIKGVAPRFRPPSSSLTPPKRPHYTIPLSPATSLAKAGVAGLTGRVPAPTRNSYSCGAESIVDSARNSTFPPSSHSLQVTLSGGLSLPLSSTDSRHQDASNQSKKQDKKGNCTYSLRSPPAASTAQYFSDSELQHYERHSSSRSLTLTEQKGQRQGKDDAKSSYPPRPPVFSSSVDCTADPASVPTSVPAPEPSGRMRASIEVPTHRISYFKEEGRSELRGALPVPERDRDGERKGALERNMETSRGQDKGVSGGVENMHSNSSSGNMQARAEQLISREKDRDRDRQVASHSVSDTIAVARSFLSARRVHTPVPAPAPVHLSASAPASSFAAVAVPLSSSFSRDSMDLGVPAAIRTAPSGVGVGVGARFDRLQNMFERVTGSAAPTVWRDSDSESSDSD